LAPLLQQFSDWYLSVLREGGYWRIAELMALESTLVPIPSETVIPPAAYLAYTQGGLSVTGVVLAGTGGSWMGASVMYWAARCLGRPFLMRFGRFVALPPSKIELAERWSAHYGWASVFFSRLLPVIRHLIGIPGGILRWDFRWYSAATLAGSLLWCSVLAWFGILAGRHPQLLAGAVHHFVAWVLAAMAVLGATYYFFVHRPAAQLKPRD
jgi:membrane protein DedA with SNARE-associated domain